MENSTQLTCPLCGNQTPGEPIAGKRSRRFFRCRLCHLIFVHPNDFISQAAEKKRYLKHRNSINSPGYVAFLNQAVEPALKFLTPNMSGLDYGCGPNPTLSILMKRQGFSCDNYDPFFFPNLPQTTYDFIFATECFEHFHYPKTEIERMLALLKPGGFLIVMTEAWTSVKDFKNWYYINDVTHVGFYHSATFEFICREYGFIMYDTDSRRVFILKKAIWYQ